MKEWAKTIPNDGILRYYIVGNMERLTVTSPAVLREILVSKAYEFAKPLVIQQTLRRVLGNGILIAEGEEHKVGKEQQCAFRFRLFLMTVCVVSTEEPQASVCVPPCQGSLFCLLVQGHGDDQVDPKRSAEQESPGR